MPIYEYRCDACGRTVEAFQKFSDLPLESCEACGGHLSKVLHPVAIHFKGSGFYTTDYGRGSGKRPSGEPGTTHDGDTAATATKTSGGGKADGGKADGGRADGGKAAGEGGAAGASSAGGKSG